MRCSIPDTSEIANHCCHVTHSTVRKLSRKAPQRPSATFLNARTPFPHVLPIPLFFFLRAFVKKLPPGEIFELKIHRNAFADSAPPDTQVGFQGAVSRQGRGGKERKGRGWKGGSVPPLPLYNVTTVHEPYMCSIVAVHIWDLCSVTCSFNYCKQIQLLGVFRLDRLSVEIANSSSKFSLSGVEDLCDTVTHNKSTLLFRHELINSSRLVISHPLQSPAHPSVLANTVHRPTSEQTGSKDDMEHDDKAPTTPNNTSAGEGDALKRDLSEKLTEVKLILVVMDVLLVLHRLTVLRFDLLALNTRPSQQTAQSISAAVNSSKPADDDVQSATQLRLHDDKRKWQNKSAEDLSRLNHLGEGQRPVGSQSDRGWLSRDHRTCPGSELVDVTQWFVIVVCVGVSMIVLLPIAALGGPRHAGIALSRLVIPRLSVLPVTSPTDNPRLDVGDHRRCSADVHRQHVDFELRQILALRQIHGT